MKIREAIQRVDAGKHNAVPEQEKVAWLSALDGLVKRLVLDTHLGEVPFDGYDMDTDRETVLLVGVPFDGVYLRWLEAQIDRENGEWEAYNASITLFNAEFAAFENDYHRNHAPRSGGRFRF